MADRKPLVDVNLATEFGGIEDLETFKTEGPARHDYTYVPGFSDMRYQRDVKLGELARHDIKANEVPILPVNMRWYRRVRGKDSDPDLMRTVAAKNQGYRPVTKADLEAKHPWLTAMPPGARMGPDGTIISAGGDLELHVCDQQTAARNAMRKKLRTEEMVDGMVTGDFVRTGEALKAGPEVKKTLVGGSK